MLCPAPPRGSRKNAMMDLKPHDVSPGTPPMWCHGCAYFSQKVYYGTESTESDRRESSGKCFRLDSREHGPSYYYVKGGDVCPQWKPDAAP